METDVAKDEPIRVLIVEDEFLISDWVTETLSEQGFSVVAVSNAADALRYLARNPIDVLFTDINLPGGMDGVALARCAREMLPHLHVVYASARVNMLDANARVPGAIFVPKPYVPARVGRLLADTVGSAANRISA